MAGTVNMTMGQLNDLIENVKANGGNSEELEGLLSEVEAEERQTRPGQPRARRERPRGDLDEVEETTQERLSREVGYLFPDGITDELFEEINAYDRDHRGPELKKECQEAGLSTSGHKKKMVARLIAARMRL